MKKKEILKKLELLEKTEWSKPSIFQESELQEKLPYPRLEMRLEKLNENWTSYQWIYGIVYKHFSDCSIEDDKKKMIFIPFSITTGNGGSPLLPFGKLELPFRDGVHIIHEKNVFNLPAFIICEEKSIINEIIDEPHNVEILKKMKRNGKGI